MLPNISDINITNPSTQVMELGLRLDIDGQFLLTVGILWAPVVLSYALWG